MLNDRYGNPVSTRSARARDAYVMAVDALIAGDAHVHTALDEALDADDGFALAHLARARYQQMIGDREGLTASLAAVHVRSSGVSTQEASAINALVPLIEGTPRTAYPRVRTHVAQYPCDVLVAQTCTSVFGMIGLSQLSGREAEQLAYTTSLAPHFGDDWWFLSMHAFAQLEVGQFDEAHRSIERSLELNPRAPHSLHVRAHLYYEVGETEAGLNFLKQRRPTLDPGALMNCHICWHVALWALQTGDYETMWSIVDNELSIENPTSPPLNVLTDVAAILARAELCGVQVPKSRWEKISAYAKAKFPNPGLAFADVHAALAHAMAGDGEALEKIVRDAKGPAGYLVTDLADGYGAYARGDWAHTVNQFSKALGDLERIGGSRAQRDLIEFTLIGALLRLGKADEAERLIRIRRPHTETDGLTGHLTH